MPSHQHLPAEAILLIAAFCVRRGAVREPADFAFFRCEAPVARAGGRVGVPPSPFRGSTRCFTSSSSQLRRQEARDSFAAYFSPARCDKAQRAPRRATPMRRDKCLMLDSLYFHAFWRHSLHGGHLVRRRLGAAPSSTQARDGKTRHAHLLPSRLGSFLAAAAAA